MKTLLLDVGSSFVKYSFYNTCTLENSQIFSKSFPDALIDDGVYYEVDRQKIDDIIFSIMDEAEQNECEAIFICTQMHGYLIQDKDVFSNYISWKDRRGERFVGEFCQQDFIENGTSLKRNLPIVSLRGYSELKFCRFFTLGSYIAYRLTGNSVTHITDACASGFFSADTCASENEYEGLTLPLAVAEVLPCGNYRGMVVYPPMGDHQISFLGSGASSGEAVLNLGTAAQLTALVSDDSKKIAQYEYRPYFLKKVRLMTLTGMRSADMEGLVQRVREEMAHLPGIKRVLICGGASQNSSEIVSAFNKLGYETDIIERNVGNEGLKRIAGGVYSRRGTMLSEVEFVNFPFLLKKAGIDFFIIDNEHGSFENKTATSLAMNSKAADVQAIVRLPNNERAMITKLADGGVDAFLLPMTNCKEDIEKVVEYAKYTPVGRRGISTTRAHTGYGVADIKEYMKQANERMKIYAQIETRLGVENAEQIAKVPGVEGVFIGPNDLSCDCDCMGDIEKIKALVSLITKACLKSGKPCGIITTEKELIRHALLCGCSMVSYGSEINMLKKGAQEITNEKYL